MPEFNPDDIGDIQEIDAPVETHEEPMPEAPASATVRVWIKGFGVMFTMRAMSNGQDAAVKLAGRIEKFIDHAEGKGWKNKWDEPVATQATKTDPNAPSCGIHGVPMTMRPGGVSKTTGKPYNAFWACPSKNADGSYCKFHPETKGNNEF